MTYTVKFELFMDGDEVLKACEIEAFLKEELDSVWVAVNNMKVLETND